MRLVKDESGEPAGWIRLDHNLYQNKFLKDLFEDERMFMILQPTGRVLYTNRPDRIDIMLISRLLRQTSPDASFMTDVNGNTSLLSYSRSEATEWMSVLIMPSNALDKALFQSRYSTIGFIGFNIALAFAASLYISRRITKPLRVLHQFIAKIGLGDFTTRVPVVSMDEIGYLGRRINDMVSQIEMLVNQVYLAERDEQLTRHQALRSQINPHFLYNTLESVDALVLKGEKLMAHQVIESLSVMLRYALKSKNQVTLQQELKHIEAYLQIQRIKYRDQFEVRIDVREEHQAVMMPPLVLQPLLENAFKHGFFRKEGIDRLGIRSEADPNANRLELHVIDNGAGAELEGLPENDRANDSIGLQNVDQRIRMQFGEGYGLHIASLPGRWFKATVVLPLKWSEKNL